MSEKAQFVCIHGRITHGFFQILDEDLFEIASQFTNSPSFLGGIQHGNFGFVVDLDSGKILGWHPDSEKVEKFVRENRVD